MNGVLLVDKPAGPTSHDVVARARKALGIRRIGHTGTLDPFATGLLVLCVGPSTRLAEYLTGLDKAYEAVARLGEATDTLDRDGEIVSESDGWRDVHADAIRAAFEEQVGERPQVPPAYSAKKVDGKRAYELARAGQAVELEPVDVVIHELDVTAIDGPDVEFRMTCSSGTYVRAVARDAGETLGVGAHLTSLRRTAVGHFAVEDAVSLDALAAGEVDDTAVVTPLEALAHLRRLDLDDDTAARVRHGQKVPTGAADGLVALAHGDTLLAVAEVEGGVLRPRKVFA